MNVTVDSLGPCKKLLRVEVDAAAVEAAFEETTKEFMKLARLPGFRPGKAPRHLVTKAYAPQLEEEVRRKLISDSFRQAVSEQKLHVVGQPDVEEVQFARGQALQFTATVELAPDFELPEYKGLPVRREVRIVTEEDIARALRVLLEQRATYLDVARPVQNGDYAVLNYTATSEGKPLTEYAATARGLTEKKDFWVHVTPDSFLPRFADQLLGAQAGETRQVEVEFPADFVPTALAGRHAAYAVEIVQVKEKVLPELTDELAKAYGAENVEALRGGVRRDLENELQLKIKRTTRDQIVRTLLQRVACELPESVVAQETKNVVYDIVRENQERGISRDVIDQQKDQIFSHASSSARDRVKIAFILGRIADREGLKATQEEIVQRITFLAHQYGIKPEQMVRQLRDRNGIAEIEEQIISGKVLEFLEKNAQFEDVLPPGGTPAR